MPYICLIYAIYLFDLCHILMDEPTKSIEENGTIRWKLPNGKLHKLDGPAVIYPDGSEYWYKNGKLHKTDGPAATDPDGSEYWYENGKFHKTDGPAATGPDGFQAWCINDQLHRLDGPAVIYANERIEWFLHNIEILE